MKNTLALLAVSGLTHRLNSFRCRYFYLKKINKINFFYILEVSLQYFILIFIDVRYLF